MKHLPPLFAVLLLTACAGSVDEAGTAGTQPALTAELSSIGDVLVIAELAELLDQETEAWLRVGDARLPILWNRVVEDESEAYESMTLVTDTPFVHVDEQFNLDSRLTVELDTSSGVVVLAQVALMQGVSAAPDGEGISQEALCSRRRQTQIHNRKSTRLWTWNGRVEWYCSYRYPYAGKHVYSCLTCT